MESVINVDMDAPIIGGGLTGRPAHRPAPHSPTSSVSVPSSPDAVPVSQQSRPRVVSARPFDAHLRLLTQNVERLHVTPVTCGK